MTLAAALLRIHAGYGPLEALHGVDLPIPAARCTVLLGRNGSGRTTALRVLAGSLHPSAGRVLLNGRDVTALTSWHRARLGVCAIPDERAVFPSLTVAEHLVVTSANPPPRLNGAGGPPAVVDRYFPELGPLLQHRAGTLSGGEQRMVALCRALAGPGRLLLLDELGRGLAESVLDRVHSALAEAVADGRTVVLAEQSLRPVARLADVVHVLHRGRVAFSGEPAELLQDGPQDGPKGPDPHGSRTPSPS